MPLLFFFASLMHSDRLKCFLNFGNNINSPIWVPSSEAECEFVNCSVGVRAISKWDRWGVFHDPHKMITPVVRESVIYNTNYFPEISMTFHLARVTKMGYNWVITEDLSALYFAFNTAWISQQIAVSVSFNRYKDRKTLQPKRLFHFVPLFVFIRRMDSCSAGVKINIISWHASYKSIPGRV